MVEPLGLFVALAGLAVAYWAEKLAWFDEATDAIGSSRPPARVEPAPWKVGLTRYAGYAIVAAGVGWFLLG